MSRSAVIFRLLRPVSFKKSSLNFTEEIPSDQFGKEIKLPRSKLASTSLPQRCWQFALEIGRHPKQVLQNKNALVELMAQPALHSMHKNVFYDPQFMYWDALRFSFESRNASDLTLYLAYAKQEIVEIVLTKSGTTPRLSKPPHIFTQRKRSKGWQQESAMRTPSHFGSETEWILLESSDLPSSPSPLSTPNVFSTCYALSKVEERQHSLMHIFDLRPGQLRYSVENMRRKICAFIDKKRVVYNSTSGKYEGKAFEGKSCLRADDAIPIVKTRFGNIITDGHHDVISCLELGIPFIPTKIEADFSHISSETELMQQMKGNGWVHVCNLAGEEQKVPPRSFLINPSESFARMQNLTCSEKRHRQHLQGSNYSPWCEQLLPLEDDPNRYFAAITACRCKVEGDLSNPKKSPDFPLWVKVGKGKPFIEFDISDALNAENFIYHEGCDQEKARKILLRAQVKGLTVVKTKKRYQELTPDDLQNTPI